MKKIQSEFQNSETKGRICDLKVKLNLSKTINLD